jgi:N-acetyl-anhydromuramyl-L-alanine amidase AmpD
MDNNPEFLIIHTAAHEGNGYDIEDIDQWHRQRGFRCVGYHYFIHKDGTLEQGRPEDLHGAHCKDGGMNTRSLGICFQGHGDHRAFTDAQKGCLLRLFREVYGRYKISSSKVHGHRRYSDNKTCPGTKVDMGEIRAMLDPMEWKPDSEPVQDTAPLESFDSSIDSIPKSL